MLHHNEFVELIIERVASNAPSGGAFFYWDEVSAWPKGKLDCIVKIGLLHEAQPMTDIECDGCEENCMMPVNIYPMTYTTLASAFITCDKRDDIGRVKVSLKRLTQWQLTAMQLAQFVAGLCAIVQPVVKDADNWRLGILQGKKHKSQALMGFDNNRVILKISGHTIDLLEALFIDDTQCRIDLKKLKDLVDSPTGLADDKESAEARQDRLLARKSELKSQGVINFNKQISQEEGLGLSTVKNLIAAAEKRKNSPPNKWLQTLGM
jgi:hypothetical protein